MTLAIQEKGDEIMHDVLKILEYLTEHEKGATKSQLKRELSLSKSKQVDQYIRVLVERKILVPHHKKLLRNFRFDLIIGTYEDGYVNGSILHGNRVKIRIPKEYRLEVLPKDQVLCIKNGDSGKIVFVLKHQLKSTTGVYIENQGKGYVIPDSFDRDILVLEKRHALPYDRVKIEILPDASTKKPTGVITRIYNTETMETHCTLDDLLEINKIDKSYPKQAMKQLEKIQENISEEKRFREDLTEEIIFTIDGNDAKDLDDAISIKKLENGNYQLGVHIADVSHYVEEGSPLDQEALKRGTSIYLIDTVIPMLPFQLSNGSCSLNPNEERLTLSCEMEINTNGKVERSRIFESVICSHAKLTYEDLNAYFDGGNNTLSKQFSELLPSLHLMRELKEILTKNRENRGSLEFDFPESWIQLNQDKIPVSIQAYPRGFANDMIEEFMLIANETVAYTYFQKQLPFIYRVHKAPSKERMERFLQFVKECGYEFDIEPEDVTPKVVQEILNHVKGTNQELKIQLMALHTMTQAKYQMMEQETDLLHFGLATYYYCHFTSPIRRYPDLMIHRIIKADLHQMGHYWNTPDQKDRLTYIAKQSSKRERISAQVTEEYEMIKKMEYMEQHIDDLFDGIICDVKKNKVEVLLDNTIVGTLCLEKQMELDEEHGKVLLHGKTVYELGQRLSVSVKRVDWDHFSIVFEKENN